ncbi:MAG: hypothetical protein QOJ79_2141 [Actinomycetota bacterium]|jgi:hypothetical protein|nr:hypothetical protein [Actinomycetota bacterium]
MPARRPGTPAAAAAAAAGRREHVPTAGPGRVRQDAAPGLVARPGRERGLADAYPDVRRRRRGEHADEYTATVPVLGYPSRRVTVMIDRRLPDLARVYADGTTLSPHRHAGRNRTELCIWHPFDPPDRRWTADEGVAVLLGMAAVHLFKEAWWRDTGEWLGEEAPHGADEPAPDLRPALRAAA